MKTETIKCRDLQDKWNVSDNEVDAYCPKCDIFICDERVTFSETCDECDTDIEYKQLKQ